MPEEKDYYKTLGVDKNASDLEIKRAYKQLAKKYHPDVSQEKNAENKFKEIQEAYSVLSDPQKRANYDRFGSSAFQSNGFQGFGFGQGGFEDIFSQFADFGFGNIFDSFGRQYTRQRSFKGEDIQSQTEISFEEAAFGTEKEIQVSRLEACPECQGTGSQKPEASLSACPDCQGTGLKKTIKKTFLGVIQTARSCPKCQGQGKTVKDPCRKCQGSGLKRKLRKIKVSIPAGIDSGNILRVANEGNAGERKAGNGDLYVRIFIAPHKLFKRSGHDVFYEMPITFTEAALGAEIKVPTLKGEGTLKIPAGTQTNTIFRLKKQGIKHVNVEQHGDQYVKVIVKTPEKLSRKEKELLEELDGLSQTKKSRQNAFDRLLKKFKK